MMGMGLSNGDEEDIDGAVPLRGTV